jgi:hypothetical protein
MIDDCLDKLKFYTLRLLVNEELPKLGSQL